MIAEAELRVAIVGAGPAGVYSAAHLLQNMDLIAKIDIFERLPTPWGLVRAGVAPDHPEKKLIIDRLFDFVLKNPRVRFFGNVEIGSAISHAELSAHYHAVIYAVGANDDVKLGIKGEELAGSWSAREFVSFYNGHPDFSHFPFDLSCERAVVVGNGNVALDVARILTRDPEALHRTDIADHALALLDRSAIREVAILGRRDQRHAAFNSPELEEFLHIDEVDISVAGIGLADLNPAGDALSWRDRRKIDILRRLVTRPRRRGNRRIIFHFLRSPLAIEGDRRVERLVLASNTSIRRPDGSHVIEPDGRTERLQTGLVLRAIGYRGTPVPGLPFDRRRGVISNEHGRVTSDDSQFFNAYTTGWIKRGCNGIIGSNKKCAEQTTERLVEDFRAGRLPRPAISGDGIQAVLASRGCDVVSLRRWEAIDHAERSSGRLRQRPRVKITDRAALLQASMADGR